MASLPYNDPPPPAPIPPDYAVPWSLGDSWLGLGMLVIIQILIIGLVVVIKTKNIYSSFDVILLEGVYIIPVVIILAWRRAAWRSLGFRKFDRTIIPVGCGFLVAVYTLILINNSIFLFFGKQIQSDEVLKILNSLPSPNSFIFTALIMAPLVEETFFRGFLFAGFRQRYGWKRAALWSSVFFAIFHLQFSVLIPTFLLGFLFSYLYEKSNSILPGMLLHFLVNTVGIFVLLLLTHVAGPIPR